MRAMFPLFLILSCLFCLSAKAEDPSYQFQGYHFLASYCECDPEALSNVEGLAAAMSSAVEDCGATVLDFSQWVFPPDGLTMVFLLSESHASIHTYPEHRSCFVDLFTCGDKCSAQQFDEALRAYLKPQKVRDRFIIRNEDFVEK